MTKKSDDKKILIVDDETIIVDVLARRFERMGFSVCAAFDGAEAIKVIKSQPIDLVICDILMPNGVHGEAVLEAARLHNPESRFVAISGNIMSDKSVQKLLEKGVDLFMKKPFPSLSEASEKIVRLIT